MSWFDIIKKDYESLEEEIEEIHEKLKEIIDKRESIAMKLGLITRGRTYNMLSDEEKEEWNSLVEEFKKLENLFEKVRKEGLEMVENVTAFSTTFSGDTKFINENI